MGLFWRRKGKDQFVTLGLNEPRAAETPREEGSAAPPESKQKHDHREDPGALELPALEPVATGAAPTPLVTETKPQEPTVPTTPREPPNPTRPDVRMSERQPKPPTAQPKPVPARTPFATSVLGLNLSLEELQAQEAALEQEFSARFRRAVAATRDSLSERLDTVFVGRKQIDDELLDQLEEALIAADIGVATTLSVLETVRRGVARKQINDLDALKAAIKDELLKILRQSEEKGVASE